MFIDLKTILEENKILPKGVIHIGAHKGQELLEYEKCGFKKVIFIEANPEVYPHLLNLKSEVCEITTFNFAISDINDEVDFHITTDTNGGGEMSSSLLVLKRHKILYPNIIHKKTIKVQSITLEELFHKNGLSIGDFNMINMDIQGAELLALKGATNLLKKIDLINTEVNKTDLYENCALIEEIEKFLSNHNFIKYYEDYKYSPEWGDAIFLKK